jgi:hypothetical protein
MAQAEWGGYLNYKAKHKDIDSVLKGSFVTVNYFSVKGGAKRIIDLNATDDISMVSEFEQARSFKNIIFYLAPGNNFEWLDFTEASIHGLPISIVFFVGGHIGKTVTHQFTLTCLNAEIIEPPVEKTDSERSGKVLKLSLSLPETRLIHGSPQGSTVVEEDW